MKPKDIIIATAVILILSSLLTGCKESDDTTAKIVTSTTSGKSTVTSIQDTIKKAQIAEKDVKLVLKSEKDGKNVKVTIALDNAKGKSITSVQNWLSYDPTKLQGVEVDISKSAFTLNAPYTNAFDNANGLMKLGRSNSTAVTDKEIHVAVATFELKDSKGAMVDAYDYREDLTGHTSANTLIDGMPYNILAKPSSPLLIIK